MGSETSIIKETPQRKGLSLKWKWALGSAAGVFLIFIIFAWFMIQAFSTQMLKTERQQVSSSLEVVTTRLQNLDESKLLPANVDDMLRPKSNDLDKVVNDPVLQQITARLHGSRLQCERGTSLSDWRAGRCFS